LAVGNKTNSKKKLLNGPSLFVVGKMQVLHIKEDGQILLFIL
jgi:hypothetical protein